MGERMKFKTKLKKLKACKEAIEWVGDKTMKEAWQQCPRGDWMLWLYSKLYPKNLREITLAKGYCAKTVYHLMKDNRSRKAVRVAIRFGQGKATKDELDAADAAYAAADAADARKKNQKKTADICRKYLRLE